MSQLDILLWIQSFHNPFLDYLMIFFSFIGDEEFYVITVPVIYLAISKRVGVRLAVVLALSMFTNFFLKYTFATPRPIGLEGIRNLYVDSAPGYSFPSGHAQGTATYWSYLALLIKKRWFTVLAGFVIVMMMLSRMYLGVHWPIDVIGGLLFGLVFALAMVRVDSYFTRKPMTFWAKVALGLAIPAFLLIMYNESDGAKLVGFLMGAWVGYVVESEFVGMQQSRSWVKRILPTVVGLLIVFALRSGLKMVIPEGEPWDVLRYAVVGLAATWWAPWLIVRFGWYKGQGRR